MCDICNIICILVTYTYAGVVRLSPCHVMMAAGMRVPSLHTLDTAPMRTPSRTASGKHAPVEGGPVQLPWLIILIAAKTPSFDPKPPLKDGAKAILNSGKILRYGARILSNHVSPHRSGPEAAMNAGCGLGGRLLLVAER